MGRISYLTLILLLVITCAGCAKHIVHQAKLPPDWPIPQLTLPNDIELKAGPEAMHKRDPSLPYKQWLVAFNKDGNWPALVAHVESCLKPLDYWRSKNKGLDNPLSLDLPEMRTYYSPDYLTEVVITDGAYFDAIEIRDIEFVMDVKVFEQPPELLQGLIKHPNPSITKKDREMMRDRIMEKIP